MKMTSKLLGAASCMTLVALGATPALAQTAPAATPERTAAAASTKANTPVSNTVDVTFSVGGNAQPPVSAQDNFVVDRRVNLLVTEISGTATEVAPNATQQITGFTVTNLSNDTLDFSLALAQQTGGAARFSGTDTFDTNNATVQYYWDRNNDGLVDGGDTLINFVDDLAAGDARNILVLTDIPQVKTAGGNLVTGDVATVILTATARAAGASGALGNALTNDSATANTAALQNVFTDGTSGLAGDLASDGKYASRDDYIVRTASVTATKVSSVISDPFGSANPKAIPGAVISYCITVTNTAGSASATGVNLTDVVPAVTTLVAGSIRFGGNSCAASGGTGATTGTAANVSTPTTGPNAGRTVVTANVGTVAAGTSKTLVFGATINANAN